MRFLAAREGAEGLRVPGQITRFKLRFHDYQRGEVCDCTLTVASVHYDWGQCLAAAQAGSEVGFEGPAELRLRDLVGFADVTFGGSEGFGTVTLERSCGKVRFPIPGGAGAWERRPGIGSGKGYMSL